MLSQRHSLGSGERGATHTESESLTALGMHLLDPMDRQESGSVAKYCEDDASRDSKYSPDNYLLATRVVMRSAGVCLPSDVSKWPTVVLGILLWGLIFVILACMFIYNHFDFSEFRCYNLLATLVWCGHAALMFTVVARDSIVHGGQLEALIWDSASEHFVLPGAAVSENMLTSPTDGYRNLKWLTAKIAAAVVLCGTINWVVSFATFTDEFSSRMLPTGDSQIANAFVVTLWFFYCIGWFLPVYFVKVPCALVMCRINRYIKYLTKSANCTDFNLLEAMRLYDELFKLNCRLQETIGFMVTSSIGLLVVHGILLLLATLRKELTDIQRSSLIFWFLVNTAILAVLSFSIADLDFGNRRIEMAFAQASSEIQFCSDKQSIRYQLALSKIAKTPFGVPFWGLKTPVSFSMTFKLAGIILSVYLFLLGYGS